MNKAEELKLTALESTDNYLDIILDVRNNNVVSESILKNFNHFFDDAWQSLEEIGMLQDHLPYMMQFKSEIYEIYIRTNSIKENFINSFENFNEEDESEFDEDTIDELCDSLSWEDIYDLYEENEIIIEPLDEKISVQNRIKKSLRMKRQKTKISTARNIKLKRAASVDTLKKRATVAARRLMYKKLLMGRDRSTLSASEKDRIEQRVRNLKFIQSAMATKLLPKIRSIEQKRLRYKKK